MVMRLKGQKYLPVLQLTAFFLLLGSLVPFNLNGRPVQRKQAEPPILKIGLIETLKSGRGKIRVTDLIQIIKTRGVAFQLTSAEEQEIRSSGNYFAQKGLDELIEAVRGGFRPPRNSPFRIIYRRLEGPFVDLFLHGQIKRQMDATVAGPAYIVHNNTFKELSYLANTFSKVTDNTEPGNQPLSSIYNVLKGTRGHSVSRRVVLDRRSISRSFVGRRDELGPAHQLWIPDSGLRQLAGSINDPGQLWRLYWADEGRWRRPQPDDVTKLLFRKFIRDRSDLEWLDQLLVDESNALEEKLLMDFYLYITKEGMPSDFGYFDLRLVPSVYAECEAHASGPQPDFNAVGIFNGPSLSLRVAMIENISKEPLSLTNFILRENNSTLLRLREADQALLSGGASQRQDLFPLKNLQPGEKIAIPMEMVVGYDSIIDEQQEPLRRIPDGAVNELKKNDGIVFHTSGTRRPIKINAEGIESIIKRALDYPAAKQYVYGPSVNLEAIEINNRDYPVRHFNPKNLLITAEMFEEVGSCPYIYTYLPEQGTWINEGVILAGINEKNKESTDEKLLSRFNGQILIKERDPEDSFIDSIFIKATATDGNETILYPQNEKLRFSDGDYLKLRQGEQLIVNFDLPKSFLAHKYVLVAKGYYVPYKTTRTRLNIRRRNKLN